MAQFHHFEIYLLVLCPCYLKLCGARAYKVPPLPTQMAPHVPHLPRQMAPHVPHLPRQMAPHIPHLPTLPGVIKKPRPIEDVVKELGYVLESHNVTTEDGYNLTLHRLRSEEHDEHTRRPPVLLQHGLGGAANIFLTNRATMAYYLLDVGYDVWLGNSRGTLFSMGHTSLNAKKDKEYWDFSFHEMGVFDLPACFEYIRDATGGSKVNYVAVSLGGTMFLAMGAVVPQYLSLLDCVILIEPAVAPSEVPPGSKRYRTASAVLKGLDAVGWRRVRYNERLAASLHGLCSSGGRINRQCDKLVRKRFGIKKGKENLLDINKAVENLPYYPAGTPIRVWEHFLQIIDSGRFQQYDYGSGNMDKYGSATPPEYDLSRISSRVYLIMGGTKQEEKELLTKKLSDVVVISDRFDHFRHMDFLFAADMEDLNKAVDGIIRKHGREAIPAALETSVKQRDRK